MTKKNTLFFTLLSLLTLLSGCRDEQEVSSTESTQESVSSPEAVAVSTSKKVVAVPDVTPLIIEEALEEKLEKTTGKLIDVSPVGGLKYRCADEVFTTPSDGSFNCESFPFSFYLGHLKLAQLERIHSDGIVYTTDLLSQPRGATTHPEVTKVSMILQSLDEDADPSNGITITEDTLGITDQYFYDDTELSALSFEELSQTLAEIIQTRAEQSPTHHLKLSNATDAQDRLTARIAAPLK